MSDLDEIYYALGSAKRAVESLGTWVRGVDARDEVRHMEDNIKRGEAAYERLCRDIRNGSKHFDRPDDADDLRPVAANLDKADEGYQLCPDCEGEGTQMIARMTPSGHTECTEKCETCSGEGQVEQDDTAAIPVSNKEQA